MAATPVPISSETTLDTAITDGNTVATQPTTGTFTANVTEAAPPTNIGTADTGVGALILDGFSPAAGAVAASEFTLTGDGTAAALRVNDAGGAGTAGTATTAGVTIENLNITNTGTANAIADFGTVLFSDASGSNAATDGASVIGAAIAGTGVVNIAATGANSAETAVIFDAANTYTGATAIRQNGTLTLGANGSIADSASVAIQGVLNVTSVETASGAAATVAINNLTGTGGNGSIILGANTLSVTESTNGTFTGVIETATTAGGTGATGGLTLTDGVLTLTGANTYEGSTRIAPGATGETATLALTGVGSIVDSANVSIKAGGTLDVSGVTGANGGGPVVNINQLNGQAGGVITLGATQLTVNENVGPATFAGAIGGTGGLVLDGVNALSLTGPNTYSGGTTVLAGSALTVAGAGTIGTGGLTENGAFDITGVTGGSVTIAGSLTGTTAAATINLGATDLILAANGADTFAGVIEGTTGALQVGTAAGTTAGTTPTLTLSNAETFTGSTRIYGDLVLTGNGSIADSANVALKAAGAELNVSGAEGTTADIDGVTDVSAVSINQLTGQAGSTIVLGDNSLIVTETGSATFNGDITGTDFFDVRGPGTLTLGGATATFDGTVVVGGHLALASAAELTHATLADNGEVDISTALSTTAGASSTSVIVGGLTGISTATLTLGANTLDVVGGEVDTGYTFVGPGETPEAFAGVISGSGGLTVGGGLQLTGANTYFGATTITGELELTGGTIANTSAIVDNGTLVFSGASGTVSAIISGTGTLEVISNNTFNETNDARTTTAGSVTLTGIEIYTGTTSIQGATLTIGAGGSIAASSGVTLNPTEFFGGQETFSTFDVSQAGGTQSIKSLQSGTGNTVNLGATNLLITGATGAGAAYNGGAAPAPPGATFDGVIAGTTGQLQIGVAESFAIGAAQTFQGSTVISGALFLTGAGSIADSANVSLKATTGATAGDGFFSIAGTTAPTVTINELTGQGGTRIGLGAHTLVVNETATGTYSGVITGTAATGGLTVDGSAFLSLDGASTYTGVTTVNGSLELGTQTGSATAGSIIDSSGLVDNGFFAIAANATVNDFSGSSAGVLKTMGFELTDTLSGNDTFAGVIHGTAGILNLTANAAHTLTLSGGSDFTGGIHLNAAAGVALVAANSAGTGAITFETGATGTLAISNAALSGGGTATESFGNAIDGLAVTSTATTAMTVDLTNLTFNTAATGAAQTFTVGAGGALVITEGNVSVSFHTDLAANDTVTALTDGHGGTAFHFASVGA